MVQAYDLGMGQPEVHEPEKSKSVSCAARPFVSPLQGTKRRPSWTTHDHPAKHRAQVQSLSSDRNQDLARAVEEAERVTRVRWSDEVTEQESTSTKAQTTSPSLSINSSVSSFTVGQGLAYSNIRDLIEYVVRESLRIGKGFDAATAKEVEGGQIIDVVTYVGSAQGRKTIEWTVDSLVPEIVRGKYLAPRD